MSKKIFPWSKKSHSSLNMQDLGIEEGDHRLENATGGNEFEGAVGGVGDGTGNDLNLTYDDSAPDGDDLRSYLRNCLTEALEIQERNQAKRDQAFHAFLTKQMNPWLSYSNLAAGPETMGIAGATSHSSPMLSTGTTKKIPLSSGSFGPLPSSVDEWNKIYAHAEQRVPGPSPPAAVPKQSYAPPANFPPPPPGVQPRVPPLHGYPSHEFSAIMPFHQAVNTIPCFDGNADTLSAFCRIIRDILRTYGPNCERWLLHSLTGKLRGRAAVLYSAILPSYTSVEQFLNDLIAQYAGIGSVESVKDELKTVAQKVGESPGDYGVRVQTILNRLLTIYESTPDLSPFEKDSCKRKAEQEALDRFLYGLRDPPEYRVALLRPATLRAAISSAVTLWHKISTNRSDAFAATFDVERSAPRSSVPPRARPPPIPAAVFTQIEEGRLPTRPSMRLQIEALYEHLCEKYCFQSKLPDEAPLDQRLIELKAYIEEKYGSSGGIASVYLQHATPSYPYSEELHRDRTQIQEYLNALNPNFNRCISPKAPPDSQASIDLANIFSQAVSLVTNNRGSPDNGTSDSGSKRDAGRGREMSQAAGAPNRYCEHCQASGHTQEYCFQLHPCKFCCEKGHFHNRCPKLFDLIKTGRISMEKLRILDQSGNPSNYNRQPNTPNGGQTNRHNNQNNQNNRRNRNFNRNNTELR